MESGIPSTANSFQRGIVVVNGVDPSKFQLLLARIMMSVHSKEQPFTEVQLAKLQTSLDLDAENVALLIATLRDIIKQIAFYADRPDSVIYQQLLKIGIESEKSKVMLEVWTENKKEVVKNLSQCKVTPTQLVDVNWRLHLKITQATKAKMSQPIAIMDFTVSNNDDQTKENVLVEFNHEELYAFYSQLDVMQSQLDSLQ